MYKMLYILIEGDDDERFFNKIIKPAMNERYDYIQLWRHAQKSDTDVSKFIKSIKQMNADYIYVTDLDDMPCVTKKKQKIIMDISRIDDGNIIIVKKEIESWYLSGLDKKSSKKCGLKSLNCTDEINKEAFNYLIPKKFDSRILFMIEILKLFSLDVAKEKNQSMKYFIDKNIK